MINKNSMDAIELLEGLSGRSIAYDFWGCTWHNVPYVVKRYVECKTAYDILALVDAVATSGGGPNQLKTLGDMTIRYGGAAASGADPNRKKQLYDCWMEYYRGLKAVEINTAVRGWYDASKGYMHPIWEPHHNRVVRPVDFRNSTPRGPWQRARNWSGWA